MVFEAGLHGINLKDNVVRSSGDVVENRKEIKTQNFFQFKSPEEYDDMSEEERKALTQKMMGAHKLKFG